MDTAVFMWAQDGAAMARLRSIGPLNKAAQSLSDKVGRRWIESVFNAIRLGENQLPHVFEQAVLAARILGMSHMPDVYVSGDQIWDACTYGSEHSSFVVIGTALINNFRGRDLMYLLAREMGHCRAGHALWKTVIRFLLGEQSAHKGFASSGILSALDPAKLVGGALELPLLAWARQAEITADRAGLIAVGDAEVARRVLLSWSLKSSSLFQQINLAAWLEQQEEADDQMVRLAEVASSSTPYISRRLSLMSEYLRGPEMVQWVPFIRSLLPPSRSIPSPGGRDVSHAPRAPIPGPAAPSAPMPTPGAVPPACSPQGQKEGASSDIRLPCPTCRTPMRIPAAALEGQEAVNIRCPNPECRKVVSMRRKPRDVARS